MSFGGAGARSGVEQVQGAVPAQCRRVLRCGAGARGSGSTVPACVAVWSRCKGQWQHSAGVCYGEPWWSVKTTLCSGASGSELRAVALSGMQKDTGRHLAKAHKELLQTLQLE